MKSAVDDEFSWDDSFPASVRPVKLLTLAEAAKGKRRRKKPKGKKRRLKKLQRSRSS